MKLRIRFANLSALLLCVAALSTTISLAQQSQRDPLTGLKRAISQANAPTLTSQEETDLNTLITNYKNSLPTGEDAALESAEDAYNAAILALNLTAAQTQATAIAARQAELSSARLKVQAQFDIAVLTILKNGGQLTLLNDKFGSERVLNLVSSLAGGGFGGSPHGGH